MEKIKKTNDNLKYLSSQDVITTHGKQFEQRSQRVRGKYIFCYTKFICLSLIIICGVIACSQPTQSDWDWWKGSEPQILFLTNDWRNASDRCVAGDSLTIGLTGMIPANEQGQRIRMALLFSASGDTEVVNVWERQIPTDFYYAAILLARGTKIPTRRSTMVVPFDNVVSIINPLELVIVNYSVSLPDYLPQPYLVLTDSTYVIKP